MPPSEDAVAWLTLTRAPGLAVPGLAAALAGLGSAQGILTASPRRRRQAGLPASLEGFLVQAAAAPTAAERRWLEHPRHHLIPFTDSRFPPQLLTSEGCPIALYLDGDAQALPVERHHELEARSGVTNPVTDKLGHQQADRVIECGEIPFSQRGERKTASFCRAAGHSREVHSRFDADNLPR